MKKTPLQQVREQFGDKIKLANLLMPKLERTNPEESDADFERRIRTMSNKKLLRLYKAHEILEKEFGSKDALIDAIMELTFPKGKPDLQYRNKLESYRITRLLDRHRALAKAAKKASAQI